MSAYANAILDNRQNTYGIKDKKSGVIAKIKGIYIKGDVLYFQLDLMNISAVDYDIDLFRFYISDEKKNKRTAVQENDLRPLYVAGNISKVKAKSNTTIVVALDKFTILDAKYLAVQIIEKNGGRHLLIKIRNRKIMRATSLPDFR